MGQVLVLAEVGIITWIEINKIIILRQKEREFISAWRT